MSDILRNIIAGKQEDLRRRQSRTSISEIQQRAADTPPARDFAAALCHAHAQKRFPVIAEIKRKSPSAGVLRDVFSPAELAREYEQGGASCLSVLTDVLHFGGDDSHLQEARAACSLPALRKDFITEEWQVYESRTLGADAILLIAAVLTVEQMQHLAGVAQQLGMAVLVESHEEAELHLALQISGALIGINNRNLRNFQVSLQTSLDLLPLAKGRISISESGIKTADDIQCLLDAGASGFLIGETLMRDSNPAAALRDLFAKM